MNQYPKEPRQEEVPSFYQQIKEAAGPEGLPEEIGRAHV